MFAQLGQSAHSLDKVMVTAGFNTHYLSPSVIQKIYLIKATMKQPIAEKNFLSIEPNGNHATEFDKIYGGYLPIGTIVAECLKKECAGQVNLQSHRCFTRREWKVKKSQLPFCHNYWLAEADNPQQILAPNLRVSLWTVGQFLINQKLYTAGIIKAQWMSTPWIQMEWSNGKVSKVVPLFPYYKTDSGFTFNPLKHHTYIAVTNEISSQLQPTTRNFTAAQNRENQ